MADFATDWYFDNVKGLEKAESAVLGQLARCLNNYNGNCFPTVAYIAEKIGYSEKTVQRAITSLENKKMVQKMFRFCDNKQTSNFYLLPVPKEYLKARMRRYYPKEMGKTLAEIGWSPEDLEVSMEEFVDYWKDKDKKIDFSNYEKPRNSDYVPDKKNGCETNLGGTYMTQPCITIQDQGRQKSSVGATTDVGVGATTDVAQKREVLKEKIENTPPISPIEAEEEPDPLALLDEIGKPEEEEKAVVDSSHQQQQPSFEAYKIIKVKIGDHEVEEGIWYTKNGGEVLGKDYAYYPTELESFYIDYSGTIAIRLDSGELDENNAAYAKFEAIRRLYFKRTGQEWLMTELFRRESSRNDIFFLSWNNTDLGFNQAVKEKWNKTNKVQNHHQNDQVCELLTPPSYREIAEYWESRGLSPAFIATSRRSGMIMKLYNEYAEFRDWKELIDRLAENPENLIGGRYEKKIYQFLNEDFIANLVEGKFDARNYSYA